MKLTMIHLKISSIMNQLMIRILAFKIWWDALTIMIGTIVGHFQLQIIHFAIAYLDSLLGFIIEGKSL